ncbi:unnamed protein product [Ascophyllum nodosum]
MPSSPMGCWRVVRWVELAAYVACVLIIMWRIPTICSPLWLAKCKAHAKCDGFLREGWLGPTRDTGDDQWRELRENLPLIWVVIAAHGILSFLVRKSCPDDGGEAKVSNLAKTRPSGDGASCLSPKREGTSSTSTPGRQSLQAFLPMGELGRRRALLNTIVSVAFGGVMHGTHCLFPLALVSGAFAVGHALKGTRLAQPATWILAILLVWLKERWYRAFTFGGLFGPLFSWLDVYAGMHPWRLTFNLAILRIISFNIDMHWAEQQRRANEAGVKNDRADKEERDVYDYHARVSAHRPMADYSLWHCLGYVFYAPLYLAGPTITYNAYVSHLACPQKSYGRVRMLAYLGRFVLALLLLEWGTHRLPVFALARSNLLMSERASFRPDVLALYVYTMLLIMWLKFLVIWRMFRFWALCDGVEPPENMRRCMSNNYSVIGFWKGWHSSFNRWLVRYIYVPLGGSRPGRRWNVFVVFLFVAFWHDVEPKLFAWGLLNGVFLALETLVKETYRRSAAFESCRANPLAKRMVQAVGATSNVFTLLLVNMIGYAVGIRGMGRVADGVFIDREGLVVFCYSFAYLFSGVQIMFSIEEAREGKDKRVSVTYGKVAES